jgi:alkyl sulfatase BDS1-like metallo-beta-lactamase superfamily hydrolase
MTTRKFLVLPLMLILLSSGIIPHTFASVESEAEEDIYAGCRSDQTLVFRLTHHDYICLDPSTAERWEKLGMAEIIQNATVQKDDSLDESDVEYYGAPPPPPVNTDTSEIFSECRPGFTQVHRFSYDDLYCLTLETAKTWERLGLVEIIDESGEYIQSEEPEIEELSQEIILEQQQKEFESKAKSISLPSYPVQPPIHPLLEASNDFWYPPEVHQVNDRIWVAVGYDIANSVMIEGDTGIIIIDTLSTYESAKNVLKEFRKITDKPIKTIIYTHGHLDHVQGTKAFLEEGDGDVEIIAHESLLDFYINENSVLGPIASERSSYASGIFLPDEGPDRTYLGVFPPMVPGTIGFVPPTHTFSDEFSLDISGVNMKLVHVAGESSDQIFIWLPDDEALLIGDNIYSIFPNIYTLRGAVYRDPMNYVNAIDQMIPLNPEYLVPSHVKPVSGKNEINNILVSTRDATQYIYDQTIRGMNAGYTPDELAEIITLPEYAKESPWISESRGQIPWHVKQIYYGNLGWYQGDPAFLLPVSADERSNKIVNAYGSVDAAILEIRNSIEKGEYNWAAELASYVLNEEPENVEAKLLKAHALRVIGQRMLSSDGRHWALSTALELEGKITIDPNKFSQTSPEQLAQIPIEKLLKSMSTRLNLDVAHDMNEYLSIYYTDLDEGYSLIIYHDILTVTDGLEEDPHNLISLDSDTHKMILTGEMSLSESINSGLVKVDGNVEDLKLFFSAFDFLLRTD